MTKSELLLIINQLAAGATTKLTLQKLLSYIVNQSDKIALYDRSTIIQTSNNKICSINGEHIINNNSEYCQNILFLIKHFSKQDLKRPLLLNNKIINNPNDYDLDIICFEEFKKAYINNFNNHSFLFIPLIHPLSKNTFLWVIEFFEIKDDIYLKNNLIHFALLANRYKAEVFLRFMQKKQFNWSLYIKLLILIPFFIIAFLSINFITDNTKSLKFKVFPQNKSVNYSRYSRKVNKTFFSSGDKVEKGEIVLEFNNEEQFLKLSELKNQKTKILLEKNIIISEAKSKPEQLKTISLLDINLKIIEERIKYINYTLKTSITKAEQNGYIFFENDYTQGKTLKIGEKIYEIYKKKPVFIEIYLDEEFGKILNESLEVYLYPKISPDKPIICDIENISQIPNKKIKDNMFYTIKVLPLSGNKLLPAMTGIAKVTVIKNNIFNTYKKLLKKIPLIQYFLIYIL